MKITINDLRIGNLVYGVSDRIEVICDLNSTGQIRATPPKLTKVTGFYDISDIKGIPLTPEILLKAGFTKGSGYHLEIPNGQRVSYYEDTKEWELYENPTFTYFPILNKPLYLHQLQNLYHALTSTELEIEL